MSRLFQQNIFEFGSKEIFLDSRKKKIIIILVIKCSSQSSVSHSIRPVTEREQEDRDEIERVPERSVRISSRVIEFASEK